MHAGEQPFAPFTSPDWLYDPTFDGRRCMAGIDATSHEPLVQQMRHPGRRVRLVTEAGNDCTSWYPEIVRDLELLPDGPHVIDGQACGEAPAAILCCFDLLVCNGKPTVHLPLTRRKALLQQLIALIDDPKPALLVVQDLPADADLFQSMTRRQAGGGPGLAIEGVVAKRRDSPYRPGVRSDDWRLIEPPG